jgi:hypothetical protein
MSKDYNDMGWYSKSVDNAAELISLNFYIRFVLEFGMHGLNIFPAT